MRLNTSYSTLFKTLLISLFVMLLSSEVSYGQIFSKKPSRKSMEQEITKLRKVIDSLKLEMEVNVIPISDTVSSNDTINPGALSLLEGEDFIEPALPTDSLLNIWYVQKNLSLENNVSVDLENSNFTTDIPDSVFIRRLKSMNSFIPLPYNNIIKNHIIYYTQKIPNKIDLVLGLSSYYMPIFEEILDEYDLPKELKVMAIIESALNPRATSRVNAKGMWQFMYRTALQYNLKINSYVDERLDPITSAHAAAKYLKDAYTIFGDWSLAIASYNCGAGNVNKAIRRAGGSKDFWKIYPFLPRETRGYVPSFVAALYTLNYYKEHRISPRQISLPAHVDTFMIYKPLHFGQISELVGISKEELSDLNPQYTKEIIPGSEGGMILYLPYNYTSAFVDKEQIIYGYKDSLYFNTLNESKTSSFENTSITHTVRKDETLSKIAQRYRVRLSDLQAWNRVKSNIKPGQRLVIYSNGAPKNKIASASASTSAARSSSDKTTSSNGYVYYTIKKNDTLWEISRKFDGVTLNDLMKLNGFNKKSKIMPGDKIKIKPI